MNPQRAAWPGFSSVGLGDPCASRRPPAAGAEVTWWQSALLRAHPPHLSPAHASSPCLRVSAGTSFLSGTRSLSFPAPAWLSTSFCSPRPLSANPLRRPLQQACHSCLTLGKWPEYRGLCFLICETGVKAWTWQSPQGEREGRTLTCLHRQRPESRVQSTGEETGLCRRQSQDLSSGLCRPPLSPCASRRP